MKKTFLTFLLLSALMTAFGQTENTNYKRCLVKSRNNNNETVPFDNNKLLAALNMNNKNLSNNSLYQIDGKQITFYIFKGILPDKNLLNNIDWNTSLQNTLNDYSDIYVDDDKYGIAVLRRGLFNFQTHLQKSSGYTITKLSAIVDTIAKDNYYYDFRAANTLVRKDCYHTDQGENFAPLDFQGSKNNNVPSVENVFVEKYASIIHFETRRNTQTRQNWGMTINFNQQQAELIKADEFVYTFYKLKGLPNVFRLLVKFDFGCKSSKKNKKNIGNEIIISPPDKPLKQPSSTGIGATPPN